VHLVAWSRHYVGGWAYDALGRRTREIDWRLLEPERLFLRHLAEWRYESEEQAEFAPDAWRTRLELYPGGKGRRISEPQGDRGPSRHALAGVPEEARWCDRAAFGVQGGAPFFPLAEPGDGQVADRGPVMAAVEETSVGDTPWLPPRPAQPAHLQELFEPGTKVATLFEPEMTVEAVREIATLRVPSGRLTVADPLTTGPGAGRELSERIAPGAYPLQAAVVAYEGHYEDERFPVVEEVAIRLLLAAAPAVTWELALAEGDDARVLRDDEIFGFATDGAAGSFADSSGWETLAAKYRACVVDQRDDAGESVADGYIRTTDEETGGDLVSFYTDGDGVYPVWLGRSESGKPVSMVVRCGYLPDLRIL
jgi:hypothetical protein